MRERAWIVVIAALISWIALNAIAGHSSISGPVLVTVSRTHGVHVDDLTIVASWGVCIARCWHQWIRAS